MLRLFRPVCLPVLASILFLSAPAQEKKPVAPAVQPARQPAKKAKPSNPVPPSTVQPKKGTTTLPPTEDLNKVPPTAHKSDVIRVVIETSRQTVAADDASFAFYGDLENVSSSTVALYSRQTVLVVAPEISRDHKCIFAIEGFFPTEPSRGPGGNQRVLLRPQEHYKVAWSVAENNTRDCTSPPEAILDEEAQQEKAEERKGTAQSPGEQKAKNQNTSSFWASLRDEINFAPGKYLFIVEGNAYTYDETKTPPDEIPPHRFVESTSLNVGVSQMTIIVTAGFGGLLAYIVVLLLPVDPKKPDQKGSLELMAAKATSAFSIGWIHSGVIRRAMSAWILSGIIAVVTSRLSEAPIPIKVSVTDVWGGFTFGFIAYFVGNKFINWLINLGGKQSQQQNQ